VSLSLDLSQKKKNRGSHLEKRGKKEGPHQSWQSVVEDVRRGKDVVGQSPVLASRSKPVKDSRLPGPGGPELEAPG